MQTRNDFAFEFQKQLAPMVAEEVISSQAAHLVTQMAAEVLNDYANSIAEQLEVRYREWEKLMNSDDQSLYTLGLRHARDLLLEQNFDERSAALATQYKKELEDESESKTS